MANRRMIASNIFTDEFFCELSITERLLWIGLIAQCADDQGRLQDKPNLINSRIFPDDGLPIETINNGLDKFATSKKIIRYSIGNKNLIQITKWWTYQTPSWAAASIYPHPPNWTDRVKVHVAGNKVLTENWETTGGYLTSLPTSVPTPLPTDVHTGIKKVKDEVKDEDEDKPVGIFAKFDDAFKAKTHLHYTPLVATKAFDQIIKAGATIEDMLMAIDQMIEKNYVLVSPASIINPTISCMNFRLRKPIVNNQSSPKMAWDILPDGTSVAVEVKNG